jgi:hypothetical protein
MSRGLAWTVWNQLLLNNRRVLIFNFQGERGPDIGEGATRNTRDGSQLSGAYVLCGNACYTSQKTSLPDSVLVRTSLVLDPNPYSTVVHTIYCYSPACTYYSRERAWLLLCYTRIRYSSTILPLSFTSAVQDEVKERKQ